MPIDSRPTTEPNHKYQLIDILRHAYSGELAAGLAYRGHWHSVSDAEERARIQQIEQEEWEHRLRVGRMLEELGARPWVVRELRMWFTGRVIGFSCHLIGWFLPMYFAGRLESRNWKEYESAALHAQALGLVEFVTDLRAMSNVEFQHEVFFGDAVSGHRLLPLLQRLFKWHLPPERDLKSCLAPKSRSEIGVEAAD